MSPHWKAWADLSKAEREKVGLILVSLKEFSYGYEQVAKLSETVTPGTAAVRFYMSSLYHYFCSYFLVGGANKLRNALESLQCGDMLEPIDEILDLRLGETTLREVMRTWRDKFLTHQTFSLRTLDRKIMSKASLTDEETGQLYSGLVTELFGRTQDLYVRFAVRYRDALEGEQLADAEVLF